MSQPLPTDPVAKPAAPAPVVVKKYANRRLYNTESSSYITLDTLAEMVRGGRDFVVYDAKTGEDITRNVLTQIIVEEESKGRAMLPTGFLRQLIGFYGDQMQALVPKYLEQAMASFARQQEQMRMAMQQTMGNFFPFGNMEEVGRQNLAMIERAMSLFTPFYREQEPAERSGAGDADPEAELRALRAEIEFLRAQLARARAAPPEQSTAEVTNRAVPAKPPVNTKLD
jgi:polyhydroxyalkanoate synthesis repressor PhaR